MTQNSVIPGSELASLPVSLRGAVSLRGCAAGPSAFLLLTTHWGAVEEGIAQIYPPSASQGAKGILTQIPTWNPQLGQRASPAGLEAGKDLQVTGIRGQADPLKLRLWGAISSPLLCSLHGDPDISTSVGCRTASLDSTLDPNTGLHVHPDQLLPITPIWLPPPHRPRGPPPAEWRGCGSLMP